MLAPDEHGHSGTLDPRAVCRARGGGGAAAVGIDALLSARRDRRHSWNRRPAVCGARHAGGGRVALRYRGFVMLVVMENHATREQIDRVVKTIEEMGYAA